MEYEEGLKLIKYLQDKEGKKALPFSFFGGQLDSFKFAFEHYCKSGDLIERTRSAYACLTFIRDASYRKDSGIFLNRFEKFNDSLNNHLAALMNYKVREIFLESVNLNEII